MEKARQFSVSLPNQPGMLAQLFGELADGGVNILAVTVLDSSDMGIVRIVVDNPDVAARVLAKESLPFSEKDVLLVKVQNKVGMLARMAATLSYKKVNIDYISGSASTGRGQAYIVLGVDNLKLAAKLLADM